MSGKIVTEGDRVLKADTARNKFKMESSIKIKRNKKWEDLWSSYQIILDGESTGYIRNNKNISIMVKPGHHFLKIKVHPVSSPQIDFDINPGEEIRFECEPNPSLAYRLLGAWLVRWASDKEGVDDWILLKRC
jgi:hypothetical protein